MYKDWWDYVEYMTNEQAWIFLKAIMNYQAWKEVWELWELKLIWWRVKKQLDENTEKWIEAKNKMSEAGKKWNKKRWDNKNIDNRVPDTTRYNPIQPDEKLKKKSGTIAVNVNVNVNDNINNIYNNNEKINKSAYAEWLDYKKKSKKWSMSEFTVKKQIKMLEQYSFEEQQNMIDRSIMNGWIWLYEKENSIKTTPSSASPLQDKENKYKKINKEWYTEVWIQTHYWLEERYYRKDETGEIWYFHDHHFNVI